MTHEAASTGHVLVRLEPVPDGDDRGPGDVRRTEQLARGLAGTDSDGPGGGPRLGLTLTVDSGTVGPVG